MGSKGQKMMHVNHFQLAPQINGDSPEDTKLLHFMVEEVRAYLNNFRWCPPVKNIYLAFGIGGIVGIFLAEFEEKIDQQDDFLWVIVGDLPSAYLVTDSITPYEALDAYISLMEDWVSAVEAGEGLEDVFPVAAQPTPKNVLMLRKRLKFLKNNILTKIR
jgi:hypothetical protein